MRVATASDFSFRVRASSLHSVSIARIILSKHYNSINKNYTRTMRSNNRRHASTQHLQQWFKWIQLYAHMPYRIWQTNQ